jgi:hypothetical protein
MVSGKRDVSGETEAKRLGVKYSRVRTVTYIHFLRGGQNLQPPSQDSH